MGKIKARTKKNSNHAGVNLHPPMGEGLVKDPCCNVGEIHSNLNYTSELKLQNIVNNKIKKTIKHFSLLIDMPETTILGTTLEMFSTKDLPGSTGCNNFFIFSTTVVTLHTSLVLQDLNKKNMN